MTYIGKFTPQIVLMEISSIVGCAFPKFKEIANSCQCRFRDIFSINLYLNLCIYVPWSIKNRHSFLGEDDLWERFAKQTALQLDIGSLNHTNVRHALNK